jgi:hypothetical protein
MKKILILLFLVGVAAASCVTNLADDPALDPTYTALSFAATTGTVTEGGQTLAVTINRGNAAYEGTLTLEVVTTGSKITNPAAEGADFSLSSKSILFDGRYTSESIVVTTAAADGKVTGDKQFGLRLAQAGGSTRLSTDTLFVTIKDADVAVISFENSEDIVLYEDGSPATVTVVRTGADWEGTVTLSAATASFANPAIPTVDYTLSASTLSFAFGETSKTLTITPRAGNSQFSGNTSFLLNITGAPLATLEDNRVTVSVNEPGGFAAFKTSFLTGTWYADYWGYASPAGYKYQRITFAATAVDSVYTATFQSPPAPFTVRFSKKDYTMTIELPQFGGILTSGASSYYTRWSSSAIVGTSIVASEDKATLVLPFSQVEIDDLYLGYAFPPTFIYGLWAYTRPDYVSTYLAGQFLLIDEVTFTKFN